MNFIIQPSKQAKLNKHGSLNKEREREREFIGFENIQPNDEKKTNHHHYLERK